MILIFCLCANTRVFLLQRIITGVGNCICAVIHSVNSIIILLPQCSLSWQCSLTLSSSTKRDLVFSSCVHPSSQCFQMMSKKNPSTKSLNKFTVRWNSEKAPYTSGESDCLIVHHMSILIALKNLLVNIQYKIITFVSIMTCLHSTINHFSNNLEGMLIF